MSHVEPRARESVGQLGPIFDAAEQAMGFVPNSMLTMAHLPQLPVAFMLLTSTIFGGDLKSLMANLADAVPEADADAPGLSPVEVQLIAFAASVAAGCGYCQAHTSHQAHGLGVPQAKLNAILDYRTSPAFSEAERALVGLALAAAAVPNEAAPEHFEALRAHYTQAQIVQIVAVIALFGFLNRWNDTMATELEPPAVDFAAQALDALGWRLGKHG